MATSSPRAEVAASRRAEKDALEREQHTRYMLNQLQQSHDALRLSTATSAATVEALQAELSSAEAQSAASRREVKELREQHANSTLRLQELEAELEAARQGRASSPFQPLPSSPLRDSIPSERGSSPPALWCPSCSRTIISPAAQLQSRSDRACSPFVTVAEPEGRRVGAQGVDEVDEGETPSTAAPAAAAPTAAPAACPPATAPAAAPASLAERAGAPPVAALGEQQLAAQLRRQHAAAKALAQRVAQSRVAADGGGAHDAEKVSELANDL